MHTRTKYLFFVLILQVVCHSESAVQPKLMTRQGRDLYHYPHPEEEVKSDYPTLTYNPSNYPREGYYQCPPSPMSSILGRGLNYVLLKIGVVAIVKAILAGLLLLKVPLFFLKMVFLKTFLFPVLIAPLLLHMFASQQTTEMKPADDEPPAAPGDATPGMGRLIEDGLSTRMWRSLKMFAESEGCVERVACHMGAYNRDAADGGATFSRALKLFEVASPPGFQRRMSSIREAFKSGVRNGSCSETEFACHGPELVIQQGGDRMRLL